MRQCIDSTIGGKQNPSADGRVPRALASDFYCDAAGVDAPEVSLAALAPPDSL